MFRTSKWSVNCDVKDMYPHFQFDEMNYSEKMSTKLIYDGLTDETQTYSTLVRVLISTLLQALMTI